MHAPLICQVILANQQNPNKLAFPTHRRKDVGVALRPRSTHYLDLSLMPCILERTPTLALIHILTPSRAPLVDDNQVDEANKSAGELGDRAQDFFQLEGFEDDEADAGVDLLRQIAYRCGCISFMFASLVYAFIPCLECSKCVFTCCLQGETFSWLCSRADNLVHD